MSDFNLWLTDTESIAESKRATLAWSRIQDKPSTVSFKTPDGSILAAQTVRVEVADRSSMSTGSVGNRSSGISGMTGASRTCVIFGVINHDTVADTVMEEGYRFILNNDAYRVVDVIVTLGSVQGNAEIIG